MENKQSNYDHLNMTNKNLFFLKHTFLLHRYCIHSNNFFVGWKSSQGLKSLTHI